MKFLEFTFDDYISSVERHGTMHPQLRKVIKAFPDSLSNFRNVILYGPKGSGKYTQSLLAISKYSPTHLRYTRKFTITSNKNDYNFKMSDIHYEVDMFLLGCNAKQLWNDIYVHVLDILSSRGATTGIILCKNFQDIHGELLENFYSYMQKSHTSIQLRFLIITEHVSFLPDNIVNSCYIVSVPSPSEDIRKEIIEKKQKVIISDGGSVGSKVSSGSGPCIPSSPEGVGHLHDDPADSPDHDIEDEVEKSNTMKTCDDQEQAYEISTQELESIKAFDFDSIMIPKRSNMKAEIVGLPSEVGEFTNSYCMELCRYIDNPKSIDFLRLRDILYDMLIYDIKVNNVLWTILSYVTHKYTLREKAYDKLMIDMYTFLQYYNNNYRPIYHLESYLLKIINTVHNPLDLLEAKEG